MLRCLGCPAVGAAAAIIMLISLIARGTQPADDGTAKFKVPPGFVVERVAAEPLVRYPLFAAFDDRGRLFVAEGTGTNLPGEELARKKLGRIMLLEDTDGDGRFDTSRVFADDLVFPQGVLWHDGALYSASHPSLWKFEDAGGQGRASHREELLTGFRFNGNGCDIHGPFLGPDGRLYWTDGRHGYKVKTRDGAALEGLASRIWRCRPDGTDVERLCGGGFDNPVQIAFTPDGEAIGTMDQGPGDALLHYVEGGVYPMEHPCLKEFTWTGPLLGAVQQYSPAVPAALCGFGRYRSAQFGKDFQNTYFATHYMLHKIVQSKLVRDGSTFRAEDRDFLTSSNHDVHLTDVVEDADGSLLFVDMGAWFTYGFPGNPIPRPDVKGGIYRIRRTDAPPVKDPWGQALGLAKRAPAELTPLLDDARPRVLDQVLARLGRLGARAVPALQKTLQSSPSAEARRNAVWALCRIRGPEARAVVRQALADPDVGVRHAAAHAAGLDRDVEAVAALQKLVAGEEPPLRRKAAESLGRIGKATAVPALLEALGKKTDRFLEHTLTYALIQIADRDAIVPALQHANPRVRQAGLVALDQIPGTELTREQLLPLLETDDEGLQQTVLEVVGHRPQLSGAVHKLLNGWLRQGKLTPARERAISTAFVALHGEAATDGLIAWHLRDPEIPAQSRALLLRITTQVRLKEGWHWLLAFSNSLNDPDLAVRRAAVAAWKATGWTQLDGSVLELSKQRTLPADLRVAALQCLTERRKSLDADSFELLLSQLDDKAEPLTRLAAAHTLGAGRLSHEQLRRLAQTVPSVSTIVIRQLLPAFASCDDAPTGKALVKALLQSSAAEALNPTELDGALKKLPAEVVEQAGSLRKKLAARQQNQAAYLAGLNAELDPLKGNPNLGRFVFFSQKAACASCHRAEGRGGLIGPDLSKIGLFRSRAEILESIVFPSLTIAPEYRTVQVQTRDGRQVTGLVTWETPDALTLRTAQLTEVRIARKDIDALSPAAVSLMPDGLERTLNRQELRDLVEFLVQRK